MANLRVNGTDFDQLMSTKAGTIGNNTLLHHHVDSEYFEDHAAITLHSTVIVRVYRDRIEYNTGGWNTVTTKERINQFMPPGFRVHQNDWVWYVDGQAVGDQWTLYRDTFVEDGSGWSLEPRPSVLPWRR